MEGMPYHLQFRLVVIGDSTVGKSCLLKTFSEGTFEAMEPTVGVDFFSKIIEIKPKRQNQNNSLNTSLTTYNYDNIRDKSSDESIIIKLQIWDTAGQERFKSIVTSYYRNSVGIVLVYDITNRESYDHLINWLSEARQHVEPTSPSSSPSLSQITHNQSPRLVYPITSTPTKQTTNNNCNNNNDYHRNTNNDANYNGNHKQNATYNSPSTSTNFTSFNPLNNSNHNESRQHHEMAYLVLGCKTDLESQRQVSYEDGKAFADLYGFKFLETSSKQNYNVNQAFQLLAEEIYDKISERCRLNKLHRTASGGHITFDGNYSQINEGIRLGPLIEGSNSRRFGGGSRNSQLLEAQPVSGYLGGCC